MISEEDRKRYEDLQKSFAERIKEKNKTQPIVYMDSNKWLVKRYPDGHIEKIKDLNKTAE